MGERSSEETAQRQAVWRQGGHAIKVQMESLVPDLSKITRLRGLRKWFLWLSDIKALPGTNSYFFR
jgi:hypothetical protein